VTPEPTGGPTGERLQKALARAGFGSRRSSEDLIRARRVTINGRTAELGSRVNPATDVVEVDGVRVPLDLDLVYLALHKPMGVVTTSNDPQGRPTVVQLVPNEPRVFPVGRLDYDSSGLLLLTNDGDFANRVSHPRYGVPKTYVAYVNASEKGIDRGIARRLLRGVELEDGHAKAEEARIQAASKGRAIVEVTVREGRNRIVRRMFDAIGLDVSDLVRTSIGDVQLGRLKEGGWRNLKPDEIRGLLEMTSDRPV
jgi:23S rRNA pseudouridine2605 synthase